MKAIPCVICGDPVALEIIGVNDPLMADVYKVKTWFAFKTNQEGETSMVLFCSHVCAKELLRHDKISTSSNSESN